MTTPDPMTALLEQVTLLDLAVTRWDNRDHAADQAAARRAGSAAVDATDQLLGLLYGLRSRLVSEIRQADDDAARIDALLAGVRHVTPSGDNRRHRPEYPDGGGP